MEEVISAAEANRRFSHLLRGVREGRSFVITNHGQPVARLEPATRVRAGSDAAFALLMERWRRQPVVDIGSWTRDELYDDEP